MTLLHFKFMETSACCPDGKTSPCQQSQFLTKLAAPLVVKRKAETKRLFKQSFAYPCTLTKAQHALSLGGLSWQTGEICCYDQRDQ